ncbi:MAG: alkaline phosphatase [Thermoanaerobaculia bacterium]
MNKNRLAILLSIVILSACTSASPRVRLPDPAVDAALESRNRWFVEGQKAVRELEAQPAKNVILFVGDGMGVSTVTAARILEGQSRGGSGEEHLLSFETLPHIALSKTYTTNMQVSDSAGTMTAMVTGVKTRSGVLSFDESVGPRSWPVPESSRLMTIVEIAETWGMSTGVVSTARLTHATPAACYAHSPSRNWEDDSNLSAEARAGGFPDIARQLIEFPFGDGLEVALGGGRLHFLPTSREGNRKDGRDLTAEWLAKFPRARFVENGAELAAVDAASTDHLLGLFNDSHMQYEHDRAPGPDGEPSLTEMTLKAIQILSKNPKGYFLMVEAGRIDHAHHDGNAHRALTDTIELSRAVAATLETIDLDETLVIVTADHSHVMTLAGYPPRGTPITGKVPAIGPDGAPTGELARARDGLPYTILGYANGPGARGERIDLTDVDTTDPDFLQEATVPLGGETHGGEDVAIYAAGPSAHLVRGVQEQNVIFHIMLVALKH